MAHRYISTKNFFLDLIQDYEPEMIFKGQTRRDFEEWKEKFHAKFMELLGQFPEKVDLAPEVIWQIEEDGLIKEKILIDTAPYTTVPAILLYRSDLDLSQRHPAIVCIHGHGRYGKEPVAGIRWNSGVSADIEEMNYNYGEQMAREGYVTISPDTRPFGERQDGFNLGRDDYPGRDKCNVHAIKGWLLGFNLLTYNLWDLMRCVDYLMTRSEVDPDRIGAMGLSGGGAHVMHFSALDERIKATDCICAVNSYRGWGIGIDNFCGTQFLPGMFRYGDHAEICGLICPRPLLVENGGSDFGFPPEYSIEAHKRIRQIYRAAGFEDRFDVDLGSEGHKFYGHKVKFFFKRWLRD